MGTNDKVTLLLLDADWRPCQSQTSGLAAVGAKRVSRRGTAFERVYIDSYVKRWLMSHGRSTRLNFLLMDSKMEKDDKNRVCP